MKYFFPILFCLAIFLNNKKCFAQQPYIIPQPVSLKVTEGDFRLNAQTAISFDNKNEACKSLALLFANMVQDPTGYTLSLNPAKKAANDIVFKINTTRNELLDTEGYTLHVDTNHITIAANTPNGLFFGMQTLMQLLPPEIESSEQTNKENWLIQTVEITDYPRFGWRGLMLDVSRHFFSKEVVKNYISEMAKYKFNVFHWHLSDDNGWRIEIKSLPQLTDVGAWRVPRTGSFMLNGFEDPQPGEKATYGGFYTQDDIREIVQFAQEKFITILPEIDIPAHSLALIASIPNISCTQLQYPVNPGTQFYAKIDNVLCVGNDSTYLILDKIFTEVANLFPGKYIHVGGDEAYKGFWTKCSKCQKVMEQQNLKNEEELQGYFEKRVEKILKSKGKNLIGWDEILQGGLAPEATVMSWRGMKGGIEAANMHHNVIMTPWQYTYLDMYQGDPLVEPPTYGMVRLNTSYEFEPVPDSIDAKYILGGQGNLWAESVSNERNAQYMTWPRAMALSEVFWSPAKSRDWENFVQRVEYHFNRLDEAGIKYSTAMYQPIIRAIKTYSGNDSSYKVKITTEIKDLNVYYSFDDSDPDQHYPKYTSEIETPKGASQIKVIAYKDGKPVSRQINVSLKELDKRLDQQGE